MKKALSMLMAFLFLAFPVRLDPSANDLALAETEPNNEPEPTIVGEAEWLRETNSETYMLSDGGYECVVYSEDKYYRDETGSLEAIDNSIIESPIVLGEKDYRYKNKANGWTVRFAGEQPGVYISANGHEISYSLQGCTAAGCKPGGHDTIKETSGFSLSGDNCVAYNGVFGNTDIVYAVSVDSVKEYIVLGGSSAPNEFVFSYELHGGSIAQTEEGVYAVYSADGERAFDFGILFAVDAAGSFSDALTYDFVTNRDTTLVTVTLDPDYMNDPERVYPIVIDPTIMITGSNNTKDSFVSSRHPTLNYYMTTDLRTGRDVSYYVSRTYIGFTIPSGVMNKGVSSAYINIKMNTGSTPAVKAYRVTGSWTSSSITWNNKPGVTSTNASGYATNYSGSWYRLYVTNIVKSWVNGTYSNYGFMLKDDTESGTSQWTQFYSSDANSPNKPELRITYYGGTRPYESVTSSDVNCMGYALQVWDDIGPSDIGLTNNDIYGLTLNEVLVAVNGKVYNWLESNKFSLQNPSGVIDDFMTCSGYDEDIPYGYYMVVFRVGIDAVDQDGKFNGLLHSNFDYHWWYMTDTGYWAEKMGTSASHIISNSLGINPGASPWANDGGIPYTSACVYYLIKARPNWQV